MEENIVNAILLWSGYKTKSFPVRDDQLIIDKYGLAAGNKLLKVIKEYEEYFYKSKAYQNAKDLITMAEISKKDFLVKYPTANSLICEAFAWCYTFDYK